MQIKRSGIPTFFILITSFSQTAYSSSTFLQAQARLQRESSVQALLATPGHTLRPVEQTGDPILSTSRFQHFFYGLEVVGSSALVHRGEDGAEDLTLAFSRFNLDPKPAFDAATAEKLALAEAGAGSGKARLVRLPELKVLLRNEEARLIYWIEIAESEKRGGGFDVLLDAKDGSVIARIGLHRDLTPINIFDASATPDSEIDLKTGFPKHIELPRGAKYWKESVVKSRPLFPSDQIDQSVKNAFTNAKRTLQYYETVHGRRGFDGRGSVINSVVHVGKKMANAFWQSRDHFMAYGDGDGKVFRNMTDAVDVAGHELTHGVIGQTAKFLPFDESGALDEAFADIFGKLIEASNTAEGWIIGARLYINPNAGKIGLRNLADPHRNFEEFNNGSKKIRVPYPAALSEKVSIKARCDDSNDNCFVHLNSTIASHAFFKIFQKIGRERTEKIYYRAMTQILTANSGFKRYASAIVQACGLIAEPRACDAVKTELLALGFGDATDSTHRLAADTRGGNSQAPTFFPVF